MNILISIAMSLEAETSYMKKDQSCVLQDSSMHERHNFSDISLSLSSPSTPRISQDGRLILEKTIKSLHLDSLKDKSSRFAAFAMINARKEMSP